jgi:hypothetical protein
MAGEERKVILERSEGKESLMVLLLVLSGEYT